MKGNKRVNVLNGLKIVAILLIIVGLIIVIRLIITSLSPSQAPELLAYYGAALSCVGTVFLGCVTYQQTRKIEEKNAEMNALRDRWEKENTNRPFFVIETVRKGNEVKQDSTSGLYFYSVPLDRKDLGPRVKIRNIGQGPAVNFRLAIDESLAPPWGVAGHRFTCLPGDSLDIDVPIRWTDGMSTSFHKVGVIYYENMLGQGYLQWFEAGISKRPSRKTNADKTESDCVSNERFDYVIDLKPLGCQEAFLRTED